MTPSQTHNLNSSTGVQYALVEVGVVLFFDKLQKFFEVTHFENERPFSNEVNLFELDKQYGTPIVFTKK